MAIEFMLDGRPVSVADTGASLLDVLREVLGERSPKDGCSPQGQCGCCTVLVDGAPRVSCVTPAKRIAGREVTTVAGREDAARWADAFCAAGASQCGFCTPGIILRLAALADRTPGVAPPPDAVEQALLAHLCRCTGWRTICDAAQLMTGQPMTGQLMAGPTAAGERDLAAASARASLEGGAPQRVDAAVALGAGGFADDLAPPDALVAVPRPEGGWVVAETLDEARRLAGKVQGRRTTLGLIHPVEPPPGSWDLTLQTTWVEPAYLELDASWCEPGGEPATPVANGGAFGGKGGSVAPAAARRLAEEHGRTVRVVLSREDVTRLGPKRPPMAAGVRADGTGVLRVVRTPGIAAAITAVAPGLVVEECDVPGPPTSAAVRAAGWAEAAILLAAVAGGDEVTSPSGAVASATFRGETLVVRVRCGEPLDEIVLRSYCIGAAHMALGWVRSEGIAVDEDGVVHDLTIRSFGVLRARDMPEVEVHIEPAATEPVNGSDAVFAAVALAAWRQEGFVGAWPTGRARNRT